MANEEAHFQEAQEGLERIKSDFQTRDNELAGQIKQAADRGFEKMVENLEHQRGALSGIYKGAIQRAESKLEQAKQALAEKQQADERKKQTDEEIFKAQALRVWMQAGGDKVSFDEKWPELRTKILSEKTILSFLKKSEGTRYRL